MLESESPDIVELGRQDSGTGDGRNDLERLRDLLLDAERRELVDLRERLDRLEVIRTHILDVDRAEIRRLREAIDRLEADLADPERRVQQVSSVLPDAIRLRRAERNDLTDALRPDIEQAMHESIRQDPGVMAEALYPVMGPTIRKLIASLFTFDQMRAGATYRVSHAYLIDRATSVPLAVHAPDGDELEADLVSGMMEALRSFVQDAFEASDFDGLQDLRVGEVNLWIEWGPKAVLAVVVRGVAPEELRVEMQETLEAFHRDYRSDLESFDGDNRPFGPMRQILAELTDRLSQESKPSRVRQLVPLAMVLIVLAAVAMLIWYLAT